MTNKLAGIRVQSNKNGQNDQKTELSISVPRTGFEPAHPCGRCDLNTVRLPISPSGQLPIRIVFGVANIGKPVKMALFKATFF